MYKKISVSIKIFVICHAQFLNNFVQNSVYRNLLNRVLNIFKTYCKIRLRKGTNLYLSGNGTNIHLALMIAS